MPPLRARPAGREAVVSASEFELEEDDSAPTTEGLRTRGFAPPVVTGDLGKDPLDEIPGALASVPIGPAGRGPAGLKLGDDPLGGKPATLEAPTLAAGSVPSNLAKPPGTTAADGAVGKVPGAVLVAAGLAGTKGATGSAVLDLILAATDASGLWKNRTAATSPSMR